MKKYLLPEDLGQRILNYLALKPYGEVWQLIGAIQNLAEEEGGDKNGNNPAGRDNSPNAPNPNSN